MLSSISGYQYTRRAWRKEAFELLMEPSFFQMDAKSISYWHVIIDNLMTHDKTTFKDLMGKNFWFCSWFKLKFLNFSLQFGKERRYTEEVQIYWSILVCDFLLFLEFFSFCVGRVSITQTGSLNLFSSKEQEYEQRTQMIKRLAFTLFCSETDQYQRAMPDIQGSHMLLLSFIYNHHFFIIKFCYALKYCHNYFVLCTQKDLPRVCVCLLLPMLCHLCFYVSVCLSYECHRNIWLHCGQLSSLNW